MAYTPISEIAAGPNAFKIFNIIKSGNYLYRICQAAPSEEPLLQIYNIEDYALPVLISNTIVSLPPGANPLYSDPSICVQDNNLVVVFENAGFNDPMHPENNFNGIIMIYDITDKINPVRVYMDISIQLSAFPLIKGNYLYICTTVEFTYHDDAFWESGRGVITIFDISTPATAFVVSTVGCHNRVYSSQFYTDNYMVLSTSDEFGVDPTVGGWIDIIDVSDVGSPVRAGDWRDLNPDLTQNLRYFKYALIMGDICIVSAIKSSDEYRPYLFTLDISNPASITKVGVDVASLIDGVHFWMTLYKYEDQILGNHFFVGWWTSSRRVSKLGITLSGEIFDTGAMLSTFWNNTLETIIDIKSYPEDNLLFVSPENPSFYKIITTRLLTAPVVQSEYPLTTRTYYASSFGGNLYPFKEISWGCNVNEYMRLNWGMRGANDGHWYGIDGSSNGQIQIAVSYGGSIAKSGDYGETWRPITLPLYNFLEAFHKVKTSSTCQYVLVTTLNGQAYLSDDYGESYWGLFDIGNWRGVGMSDSGQYMVVGNEGLGMYPDYVSFIEISKDYATTWSRVSFDDMAVNFVGMSGDGSHITVGFADWTGASLRALAVSTDSGASFVFKGLTTFDDGFQITDIKMSYDGQYQTISDMGWGGVPGKVWVSDNYGATWIEKGIRDAWTCIAMDRTNHQHLIVGKDGWMRESFDFGDTWTEIFTGARWNSIFISHDSSVTVAVMGNTAIFNESYIYKKGYFFNDNDILIISGYHTLIDEFYIRRKIEVYGGAVEIPEVQAIGFHVTSATANANIHDIYFIKSGMPYDTYFIFIDDCTLNDANISRNYFNLSDTTNADNIVAIRIMGDVVIPYATLVISNNYFENIGYAIQGYANLDNTIIFNNAQFSSGSNCFMFLTVASNANNVKVFNNTILGVILGISVLGIANDLKIINNIITVTPGGLYPQIAGIRIANFNSGVLDYNCIYGFNTTYNIAGSISAGLHNTQLDPKMDGLLLKALSPCIDSGAGVATDADIPIIDIRGIDRPQVIPFYVHVTDGTDMGCYEMLASEVEMTGSNLYVVQRTNRHVVKRFDSTTYPIAYNGAYFGEFQLGSTDSTLNFPSAVVVDSNHNVFVCDTLNNRILKLNFDLQFVSKHDTTNTIGKPYAIMTYNNFIYAIGLYSNLYLRIEKLNNNLVSLMSSTNLSDTASIGKQLSICKSFDVDKIFIAGASVDIYETTETVEFSPVVIRQISGESRKIYTGAETSSGYLYLNDGTQIIKVNSSFENVGDSNKISKTVRCLRKDSRGNLLVYNVDRQSILSYNADLNFVAELFVNSGPFIGNDAYDIMDITEAQL
jgi:hypothetical protein